MKAEPSEWRRFLAGRPWTDIVEELGEWKKAAESEYTQCKDLQHLGSIQGRIEALGYMVNLPQVLLEQAIEDAEQRQLGQNLNELDEDNLEPGEE